MLSRLTSRRRHNRTPPVFRLPNELLSEVVMHGWFSIDTHSMREQYRAALASVSTVWNVIIVTDPRLWAFIRLSDANHPISSKDVERIQTILARSGLLPLHLRFNFTQDGLERTTSLEQCLALLKAPEYLARCESIHITTTGAAGWEAAFPLKEPLPLLHEFRLTSTSDWMTPWTTTMAENSTQALSLFEYTPPKLEHLEVNIEHPHSRSPHLNLLTHIDPTHLRVLSFRGHIPHEEALPFIQASSNLQSLELELRVEDIVDPSFDDEGDDPFSPRNTAHGAAINGIYVPTLKSLKLWGPSAMMLSAIICAPSVTRLHFVLRSDEEVFALSYALLAASAPMGKEPGLEGMQHVLLTMEAPDQQRVTSSDLVDFSRRAPSSYHHIPPSSSLRSPSIDAYLPPHSYPSLHELTITGDTMLCIPPDAFAEFISSSTIERKELANLTISAFANLPELLAVLNNMGSNGPITSPNTVDLPNTFNSPSLGIFSSNSGLQAPKSHTMTLASLTIIDSPHQHYPLLSTIASSVESLMNVLPTLSVTWLRLQSRKQAKQSHLSRWTKPSHFGVRGSLLNEIHQEFRSRVHEVISQASL